MNRAGRPDTRYKVGAVHTIYQSPPLVDSGAAMQQASTPLGAAPYSLSSESHYG